MALSIGRKGNYITLWTSEFGKVDLTSPQDMIIVVPIWWVPTRAFSRFFCFRNYRGGSIAASP